MTTEAPGPPSTPIRAHDIFLAITQRWANEHGETVAWACPVEHLRKLILGVPETVSHLRMGPKTAHIFLSHPAVAASLHLIVSVLACGTVGGEFTMRGLSRFEVSEMEEGIVLAINTQGIEVGRLTGALR